LLTSASDNPPMMRAFILALLLAASAAATAADRGDRLLRHAVLGAHNEARERFGVPALAWNDQLAADALSHARLMARTGIYGHDRTPGRRKKAGENIWRGPRGLFSYEVMVGVMVEESRNFRPGVFPNVSRTGDWSQVAHYTQIVWPTTTEVGCALASSATTDYFVCRYAPTGNKDGYQLAERRD
jgi:hypothetical protein